MGLLAALLLGAAAAALAAPAAVLWLAPALQPLFAVTMFCIGTLVRREDLAAFAAAPLRPVTGLAAQYTIMPLLAAVVAVPFRDPVLRTGIVLVGCMPGAMASNVMTLLVRGDLVLSVTLTTLATLLCPLVLAFWLPLLADARIPLAVSGLVWNATWMVVIPVSLGIAVRGVRGRLPAWWDRSAARLAAAAIVAIVLVVVAKNDARLARIGGPLAAAMIGLNLAGYGLAFVVGTALRWPPPQRRTLVIEVGMQNAGLGSVLALAHLGPAGAVPSAFYTVLCVLTAAAGASWLDRRRPRSVPLAAPDLRLR